MKKKQNKIYCKDCGYCGDTVPLIIPGASYFLDQPVNTMKIYYIHGIEIEQRYCKSPEVPKSEEIYTFYDRIKNNYKPQCHEINKDNDCKYFKKGD